MDVSGSVSDDFIARSQRFLDVLVDSFRVAADATSIAVLMFSDSVTPLTDRLAPFVNTSSAAHAALGLLRSSSTGTAIGKALRYVRRQVVPLARSGIQTALVIMTDGFTGEDPVSIAVTEATLLKNLGVRVLPVGIAETINATMLNELATSPETVFALPNIADDLVGLLATDLAIVNCYG